MHSLYLPRNSDYYYKTRKIDIRFSHTFIGYTLYVLSSGLPWVLAMLTEKSRRKMDDVVQY